MSDVVLFLKDNPMSIALIIGVIWLIYYTIKNAENQAEAERARQKEYEKISGEQQAIQENISAVTRKMESVKQSLSFETQAKMALRQERINSLKEGYAAINEMIIFLDHIAVFQEEDEGYNMLLHSLSKSWHKWISRYSYLPIFIEKSDLIKLYRSVHEYFFKWIDIINKTSYKYHDIGSDIPSGIGMHDYDRICHSEQEETINEYKLTKRDIVVKVSEIRQEILKLTQEEIKRLSDIKNL